MSRRRRLTPFYGYVTGLVLGAVAIVIAGQLFGGLFRQVSVIAAGLIALVIVFLIVLRRRNRSRL